MAHHHWKKLFQPHIWQRGLDYYHDGHVLGVQHRGNQVTAEIEGTKVYTVSVILNAEADEIEDYFCDCPYGEDGTPCKHLAALLCALEDGVPEASLNKPETLTIEQAVNSLSEQQMREILIQLAKNDSSIREKIHIAAARKLPVMQKNSWEQDLDELTEAATGRSGYIDYEEAYDYCSSLCGYLEDRVPDLLSAGLNKEAFDLTCLVFQTGMEQDMDDSDGGLTILAASCTDIWSKLLEYSDLGDQREMLRWFTAHCFDNALSEMFLVDYVFDAPWDTGLASDILQFWDQLFQKCQKSRMGEYQLDHLIGYRIQWMKKSVAYRAEINQFIEKYHHLPAVRDLQISQALQDENYEEALMLLEESKKLDKEKIGLVAKSSARKIEIYELTNNPSALREELESYIFTFRQDDLTYVNKMKAILPPSEWQEMRKQLLNSASMLSQAYPLLAQEEMYGQLMERITARTDIHALERYESLLKETFSRECMNVYITYLHPAMGSASNRKAYWSVIQTLKKLHRYPSGKAVAQELADGWKQKYPRRSSMLDELKKAGF